MTGCADFDPVSASGIAYPPLNLSDNEVHPRGRQSLQGVVDRPTDAAGGEVSVFVLNPGQRTANPLVEACTAKLH